MPLFSHRIPVGDRLEQVEVLHLDGKAGGEVIEGEVIVLPLSLDFLAEGQAQVPVAGLEAHGLVQVAGHGRRNPGRDLLKDHIIPVEIADTDLELLFFVHVGLPNISRQRKMETGLGLIDGLRVQFGGRTGDPVDESTESALLRPRRNEERDRRQGE